MPKKHQPLILMADADEYSLTSAEQWFPEWGFRIQTAHTNIQFFEQFDKELPAALLLSAQFGGGHGLELLRELIDQNLTVPVILSTKRECTNTAVSAIKLGAFDCLAKPFHPDFLRNVITHAIENATATPAEPPRQTDTPAPETHQPIWGKAQPCVFSASWSVK
ncbi:MAG: response regulator [Gemmataceae bacterium]